jgi:hypothetical protein
MPKDPIGELAGAFFAGLIFIPIGAVLYSVTQNAATGILFALIPVFFALIELGHVENLTEEGILSVLGWVLGLITAVYLFPQYWAFGTLSVVLSVAVLVAKIEEWI